MKRPSKSEVFSLDALDRAIINRLQSQLPLHSRPFAEIGAELGACENEIVARTSRLLEAGILTRFGPFIDAEAMGGAFCLCALPVPRERFDEVADIVNGFREVAHNYERDHDLNMWFVLATDDEPKIAEVARCIEGATGLRVFLFPKEREFFIGFRVAA
jgi:DNA-binding Lrp family transcriptional regulator